MHPGKGKKREEAASHATLSVADMNMLGRLLGDAIG